MFTLTWITEKELERVIKKKGDEFCSKKKTWKFHSGGKKIRNARGQQGEASRVKMSGSEKNTSDHEHKQQDFWWAHTAITPLVVQNGIAVVQTTAKKCTKRGPARENLFFAT